MQLQLQQHELQLQCNYNYTNIQLQLRLQLHYATSLHHTTSSTCGWSDHCNHLKTTQLQPPFGPSADSLCHPCITTTHLSYSVLSLKLPPPTCAVLLVLRNRDSNQMDQTKLSFATTFWLGIGAQNYTLIPNSGIQSTWVSFGKHGRLEDSCQGRELYQSGWVMILPMSRGGGVHFNSQATSQKHVLKGSGVLIF